ncbi:MAG: efflux transporter periplasmic adaptor subunit [Halieaceae bacterium MED-G27]|nr:MAG: efflux transporter periplasmic adaptor subunit [Halieaceae bacterium MED-G27]
MTQMLRRVIGPVIVVIVMVAIVQFLRATAPEPEMVEAERSAIGVYIERASAVATEASITVYGEVRPRVEIELLSEVGGRITSVSPEFIEGGLVRAGDAILTLEDDDYRVRVAEARARVASNQLALEQAKADADVAEKQLLGEPNPSELALKIPQIRQAEAALAAANVALESAETDLARTRVTLPFDVRIANTMVDEGQYLTPGRALASVFSTDVAEVRLPLSDSDLAALGVPIGYQAVDEGLRVTFSADVGGREQDWRGYLTRVDASIEAATRTVFATAEVRRPYEVVDGDMPLAPGLFVKATISGRALDNVLEIPAAGLRAGDRVFVMTDNDDLQIKSVDVAYANADYAYIRTGLTQGERVIVSPIRNPVAGMPLSAIESTDASIVDAS